MKRQIFHLTVLFLILAVGVGTFFYTKGDRFLQLVVGVLTALAYVGWGLIHHAMVGDLHPKVMVEYILMGAIAIIILVTLLL